MDIVPLTAADIPEVMRIERLPGYDAFVARFEAGEHAEQMASPQARYFGMRGAEGLNGFALLQHVGQPWALLRRIAIESPGGGQGARLLRHAMDWIFTATPAEALTLGVALDNDRARHVYLREGFTRYGGDEIHHHMAITRDRWAELHGA